MSEVVIVDYGLCNLDSIARALEECGARVVVTSKAREVERAARLVLPGVGSFGNAMTNLRAAEMVEPLRERALAARIPFLGICLGMQLLATRGEEGGENKGLDIIEGDVVRLNSQQGERIPHIGWNEVDFVLPCVLGQGIEAHKDFYFVHSFHFQLHNNQDLAATTPYCGGFASVIGRENVWGIQFHPEKSQKTGFALLRNFLGL